MLTIEALFSNPPKQWGLRGDPALWRVLEADLTAQGIPSTATEFSQYLENYIHDLVAKSGQETAEQVYIPALSVTRGMSAGTIYVPWWFETGIPLLMERYSKN